MKRNILHIFLVILLALVAVLFILVINLYTRAKNTPPQKETKIVEQSITNKPEEVKIIEKAIPETQAAYDKFSKYGITPREAKYYECERE